MNIDLMQIEEDTKVKGLTRPIPDGYIFSEDCVMVRKADGWDDEGSVNFVVISGSVLDEACGTTYKVGEHVFLDAEDIASIE